MTGERIVRANGVDLCLETFGDPTDPAILLIAGAGGSRLSWEDDFCERLAAGSRFVIRYDNRDAGRSVTYQPGAPEYTGLDLVGDAVGILDALGVDRAHLVGISMGGGSPSLSRSTIPIGSPRSRWSRRAQDPGTRIFRGCRRSFAPTSGATRRSRTGLIARP